MIKFLNDVDSTNYVGKVLKSRNYGDFRIVKFVNTGNVEVEFTLTGFKKHFQLSKIKTGAIKDPFYPSVCGVGFIGDRYKTLDKTYDKRKHLRHYEAWVDMLKRCYTARYQEKLLTYKGCEVSNNFKSYTYFYEWCEKQIGFDQQGWCLDKDILIKGNKIYSESICVFVPNEVNCLFTKTNKLRGEYPIGVHFCRSKKKFVAQINRNNEKCNQEYLGAYSCPNEAFIVYKQAKEAYIKEVANKWKERIDPRVYEALLNYQVEITD